MRMAEYLGELNKHVLMLSAEILHALDDRTLRDILQEIFSTHIDALLSMACILSLRPLR